MGLNHKIAAIMTTALLVARDGSAFADGAGGPVVIGVPYVGPVGGVIIVDGDGGPSDGSIGSGPPGAPPGFATPPDSTATGAMGDASLTTLTDNIMTSVATTPNLVSLTSFTAGCAFAVSAMFKLKEHVDMSGQTPLRTGMVRLATAGSLLALPFILTTMEGTITGGTVATAIAPTAFVAFAN